MVPLAGKPLVEYTLAAATACSELSEVAVTSDCERVLALGRSHGARVLQRPPELASDNARSEDVVIDVLDRMEIGCADNWHIVLLQPTSPLRTADHITEAIAHYRNSDAASLMSVTIADPHPDKCLKMEGGLLHPFGSRESLSCPRQLMAPVYRQNGAIYIMRAELFRSVCSFFADPAVPYVMEAHDSVDIDNVLDLKLAELLLAGRQLNFTTDRETEDSRP